MLHICSSLCSKIRLVKFSGLHLPKVLGGSTSSLALHRQFAESPFLGATNQHRQSSSKSETSKNVSAQRSANRAFHRVHISSMVTGIAIFLFARYYYKNQQRRKLEQRQAYGSDVQEGRQEENPTFTWEHTTKATSALIQLENTWFPKDFIPSRAHLDKIRNFELGPGDVMVSSFPKSGTTWMQEIVYLIHTNLDVDKAKESTMEQRFPYLEFLYPGLEELKKSPSPRLLKTHLPYHLLPKGVLNGHNKVICIVRNPKDVLVSYFHFISMLRSVNYKGTIDELADYFVQGKVGYGPWPDHVLGFWKHREDENVLFVTYEDLHKDPEKVIGQVASFLGHKLTDLEVKNIAKKTSFKQMKENPTTNYTWWKDIGLWNKEGGDFMRKGVVGDWQGKLSSDVSKKLDDLCEELTKNGLTFTYTQQP